ncbi:hypothetical protein [Sphingomonas sp. LHG3406-1]|uniref:hypothetical protein n=1 Tax=Sphingomonas sp. LHG3406-1 TaxID=2804617 RepID=UPI002617A2AF|nr:hypothetical protein [Sphingomonas sp. LHG3406-1]
MKLSAMSAQVTPLVGRAREAGLATRDIRVRLSKSRIAAFEHCPRRLWLQLHRPELARFDERTLRVFAAGHHVGALARARHPDGFLVAEDHLHLIAAIARTEQLIRSVKQVPIFEAAFHRNGVVVRVDILEPDRWGGWRLIEVKNSGAVKPYQLLDVSTQAWVITGNGICLSSVIVRHVSRPMMIHELRPRVRFVDADVTDEVTRLVRHRGQVVDRARQVATGAEPRVQPGRHCTRPFRCEFRDYCNSSNA